MRKLLVLLAALAGLAVATSSVGGAASAPQATPAAKQVSCSGIKVGFMGPWTGPAASIGQEQLKWGRYALARYNAANPRLRIRALELDTQLDAAQAATRAVQAAADSKVMAVVGPAGSQEIISVANTFRQRSIGYISGSATRTSLTIGAEKVPTFFRTVGNDATQAATDATFIYTKLAGRRVWVIDDQSAYSVPLANGVVSALNKRSGTTVTRESVNQDLTDFSSLIARIPANTQVIFLPWQLAARAATFYQQLRQQGKSARVIGSDGLDAAEWLQAANGQYFSAFAPDVKRFTNKAIKALVATYVKRYGKFNTTFGPPTYEAMRVATTAIKAACKNGQATRGEVLREIRKVNFAGILGYRMKFKANSGDIAGAKFFIFRINNGSAVLVP
jgi:branched-chain amino acid transport system substrate-binding protein